MTHYEVLGVGEHATADEIRQAYRRRARDHHPDANPADAGAGERFRAVALAYQVLSDPRQRAQYDATLARPAADRPVGAPEGGGEAPGPDAEPGVADRIVQAVFVLPLLAVPGVSFLVRIPLLVAGWFVAGYLLHRHAAAVPREWPWWRSPGWTGGGRLLRVAAVVAGLVVAGIVLWPMVDRAQAAIDAQGIVEDAVTARSGEGQGAGDVDAAIERRDAAVDDLKAAWWRAPAALAIVAGAWVGSARLPGRFRFQDRRVSARRRPR